jgi:hypothetical protein
MSEHLRDALRAGFTELTAGPVPAGLDVVAVRQARRRLAAQAAGTAALVAVVTAGTVVGVGAATRDRSAPPAAGTGVMLLAAASCEPGSSYDRPDEPIRSYVLDRRTGRYETVGYCGVVPSPDGRLAVVADGDPSAGRPERQGIMDLATGRVRWIPGRTGAASWAPNSRRLLLLAPDGGTRSYVVEVSDPASSTEVTVPGPPDRPIEVPVWRSDSTISVLRCRGCPPEPSRIPIETPLLPGAYGAGGRHQVVVIAGRPWSPLPITSPDGTEVAVPRKMVRKVQGVASYLQILDARTGAYRGRIDLPDQTELVGWYDDDHLVTRQIPSGDEANGTSGDQDGTLVWEPLDHVWGVVRLEVRDRSGSVLHTADISPGRGPLELAEMITIAPAGGVPDPDGRLGF